MTQTKTKEECKKYYKDIADVFLHKYYKLEMYIDKKPKLLNGFSIEKVLIKKRGDGDIQSVVISDNDKNNTILYHNVWQELVNVGKYESEINGNLYKESIINYLEGII